MSAAEINPVQTTIPAVDKSALPAGTEEIVQIDGASSLAKEGVKVSDGSCNYGKKF